MHLMSLLQCVNNSLYLFTLVPKVFMFVAVPYYFPLCVLHPLSRTM
jgi:hypothetical protein